MDRRDISGYGETCQVDTHVLVTVDGSLAWLGQMDLGKVTDVGDAWEMESIGRVRMNQSYDADFCYGGDDSVRP